MAAALVFGAGRKRRAGGGGGAIARLPRPFCFATWF